MRIGSAIILGLLACLAARAQEPVNRVLRTLDFEERSLGNTEDLPMHWLKVEGHGMPHYVTGRLTTDRARSGQYSFRFDLNGGSLIYRYQVRQMIVQPRSHYRVEVFVQTTSLKHARARLTAYFISAEGKPLGDSIRHSPVYAAGDENQPWHHLQVELSVGDLPAMGLVVELGLVQPEIYSPHTLGAQALHAQDIRGTAWFDDVRISQVPQVTLSTDRPGNIFKRGELPALIVLVNDRSTDDLAAQLVIRDAAGRAVYQRSGALDMAAAEILGRGERRMQLSLPQLPPGWYQASLVMTSKREFVGQQDIALVLLADSGSRFRPDDRFGVIATDLPPDGWAELPDLLPYLAAGRVKLAIWSRNHSVGEGNESEFDELLVQLRMLGITPTACLVDLPPSVTRRMTGATWPHVLKADAEDWQPALASLIARHANYLDRWQLGADGSDAFVTSREMRDVYERIYGEFSRLVQSPDLAMPWPAWYELDGQLPATVALSLDGAILPSQIPLYMQDIKRHKGHNLSLSLQMISAERYGRELVIRDLAQRIIYALAADAQRIDVPLPFTVFRERNHLVKQPQELLIVLRTLTGVLSGARFRNRVPMGEGIEAFLFDRNGQGILALWDRGGRSSPRQLALTLGERPFALDLWGNATPLLRVASGDDGQVQLEVGSLPMFIMDIDANLAQLRSSVAFDRPLIESSFVQHTRKIRFVNPYRHSISGTLRLVAPSGWSMRPPTFNFNLNSQETFEREVEIEFPYNSFAGPKTIDARFEFQADRQVKLDVPLTLMLGLSDVGLQTLALRDGEDIFVQQIVTNYGDKRIDYTAFAMFPGQARQERLVTGLEPGRSTIKMYRFAGVGSQKGGRVRSGVRELVGTRILNDEVEVP